MKIIRNKVSAITGAGSGIGRALAVNLAAEGCHLAIADINKEWLQETVKLIRNDNIKVTTHVVDVAIRDHVYRYADEAVEQHGGVDIIINNAGVAVADTLDDISYEDFEWLMGTNFWGVVYGTKAFLPYLRKRPEGHIVNISSINGILPQPNNGPYVASKFAVRGFTEALAQELTGTSIGVTIVHPGGIKTNIARNCRFNKLINPDKTREDMIELFDEKLMITSADKAAHLIISGIRANKRRIMVGPDARILDWLTRLLPVTTQNLARMITLKLIK